jgi:hypothetical protein
MVNVKDRSSSVDGSEMRSRRRFSFDFDGIPGGNFSAAVWLTDVGDAAWRREALLRLEKVLQFTNHQARRLTSWDGTG